MKYFSISCSRRGCNMSSSVRVVACKTRRDLRAILAEEAKQMRAAEYVGPTDRKAAAVAAAAWREAHEPWPSAGGFVIPCRSREGKPGVFPYSVFCSVISRKYYLYALKDDGA
jgi:hypothetical protein